MAHPHSISHGGGEPCPSSPLFPVGLPLPPPSTPGCSGHEALPTGLRGQGRSVLVLHPSVCVSLSYTSLVPAPGRPRCLRWEGAQDRGSGDVDARSAPGAALRHR